MGISRKIAAIAVACSVVLGAGAFAWAEENRPTPSLGASAAASATAATPGVKARGAGLLKRVEHGDLLVKTKNGFQPVTYDRGKVTAASPSSVTIQRPDGQSVTVAVDSSTRFRGVSSASDLKTGKAAVVLSRDGKALVIAQRDKDRQAPQASQGSATS